MYTVFTGRFEIFKYILFYGFGVLLSPFSLCRKKKLKLYNSKKTIITANQEENIHAEQQKSQALDEILNLSNGNEIFDKTTSQNDDQNDCSIATQERYIIGVPLYIFLHNLNVFSLIYLIQFICLRDLLISVFLM